LKILLKKQKAANASAPAAIFNVSIDTVRRDLEMLEKRAS